MGHVESDSVTAVELMFTVYVIEELLLSLEVNVESCNSDTRVLDLVAVPDVSVG